MVFAVLKSGDQAQIASAMQSLHLGGDSAAGICGCHVLADGNLSGGLAASSSAAGSSSRSGSADEARGVVAPAHSGTSSFLTALVHPRTSRP